MILGDGRGRLELAVVEVQPPVPGAAAGGDVRLSVALQFDAFAGALDAWIGRDNWSEFIRQLQQLEETRTGQAILESMTPGELRLRFHSLDLGGHMGVEGELVRFASPVPQETVLFGCSFRRSNSTRECWPRL